MKYHGLDLNLLVALDALLTERHVSKAARRSCVTQPAMSAALRRLREHFRDPLLVPLGRQLVLTSVAEALAGPVSSLLRQVDETVLHPAPFDPATSTRTFKIRIADVVLVSVLRDTFKAITSAAPGISLEFISPRGPVIDLLERGEADLIVHLTSRLVPNHPSALLLEDDHAVIACASNPVGPKLTIEQFTAAGHVEVQVGPNPPYLENQLLGSAIQRRIEIKVDTFLQVPFFVSGSKRLATLPSATAKLYQTMFPLKLLKPPMPLKRTSLSVQWLRTRDRDPAIRWLCDRMVKRPTQ